MIVFEQETEYALKNGSLYNDGIIDAAWKRQYGIGFNFVPWGDVIEKGETNVIIVKKKPMLFV